MRRWRSWRCRSAPSGTFARSRCGVPGAGVSGDPRVALKVRAGSRLGAPAWRGTPPRSSAGVRVDAGQERHREWRRGAVIQGREDVVRLEGITRKRAEKEGHDDRQNVESPDVGQLETHVTGAPPNDLDQKGQRSADRAEEQLPRGSERVARQDSGEQERRERPEERADRSFCARQTEENHENTDERPLSNGRSDKPTARLPRARGALKDQVINRHGNTVRSLTEPGNVLIGHCRSVTLAGNTMRCGRVRRSGYVFLWRSGTSIMRSR